MIWLLFITSFAHSGKVCLHFKNTPKAWVHVNDTPLGEDGATTRKLRRGCVTTAASMVSVNAKGKYVEVAVSYGPGFIPDGVEETGNFGKLSGSYDMDVGPAETVWLEVRTGQGPNGYRFEFEEVEPFELKPKYLAPWHGMKVP